MISRPPPRRIPLALESDPEVGQFFREMADSAYYTWEMVQNLHLFLTGTRLLSGHPNLSYSSDHAVTYHNSSYPTTLVINGNLYAVPAPSPLLTGTTATFPADTWGIALVSVQYLSADVMTWSTNDSAGFPTEAIALNNLPALPDTDYGAIGYFTVQADAANAWLAGTDALEGGAAGNPAQTTNYYNVADPLRVLA